MTDKLPLWLFQIWDGIKLRENWDSRSMALSLMMEERFNTLSKCRQAVASGMMPQVRAVCQVGTKGGRATLEAPKDVNPPEVLPFPASHTPHDTPYTNFMNIGIECMTENGDFCEQPSVHTNESLSMAKPNVSRPQSSLQS